ncbi:MAG TPA: kelch repeat-containing protein [Labilithrix sp.]
MRPARLFAPLLVLAAACGLLAPPGEYTSGGDAPDAATEASDAIAPPAPPPPGDVPPPPGSAGTLFLVAGERDPTSPADDPAWSSDVWEGVLDAQGHVLAWNVRASAAIPGPYDSAAIVGAQLFTLSFGLGVNGGRGDALSEVAWAPGASGAWKAVGVGMPGGLDERARAIFGAHVVTVGGVRYQTDEAGTTTIFTKEVHVADIDTTMGTLGSFRDAGVQLTQPRSRVSAAVIDGVLYAVGGRLSNGAFSGAIETAKVDATMGTVGAFTAQPTLVNGGVEHKVWAPSVAGGGGLLFVAGGRTTYNNGGQPTNVVVVAQTTADGTVSNVRNGPPLATALRDLAITTKAGRLFAIGGDTGMNRVDTVYSATIAADGTLGAWETEPKLPAPRSGMIVVPYGGTP